MTTSNKPLFQHRHYVKIAEIIAAIADDDLRHFVALEFRMALNGTNPNFDSERFLSAAKGYPSNGRDKVR